MISAVTASFGGVVVDISDEAFAAASTDVEVLSKRENKAGRKAFLDRENICAERNRDIVGRCR